MLTWTEGFLSLEERESKENKPKYYFSAKVVGWGLLANFTVIATSEMSTLAASAGEIVC
jgi:hypothetical protein